MFKLFDNKMGSSKSTHNSLWDLIIQVGLRLGFNTNSSEYKNKLKNLFSTSRSIKSQTQNEDSLIDLQKPLFQVIANIESNPKLDLKNLTQAETSLFNYIIQRILGEGLLQSTYIMLESEKNNYKLEADSEKFSFLRGYGQLLIDYNEFLPKEIRDVVIKQYLYLLYKGSSAEEYDTSESNCQFRHLEDKLSAIFFPDVDCEERYIKYFNIVDVSEAHNYHLSCMAAQGSMFHLFPSRLDELTTQATSSYGCV
ncbi:hypothetical protein [Legionella bononiensis]|uniref:Uncharacterized protein n=1 Tax=Legionella bononiensis TaxID=2793102 RepID=A0ABS1WAN7_9GAMM|nr:hypothetical protein [Legionella bononiensis]MBL7480351.1 hypothetical protein [Legionella bononiensis]MBL7526417.1 hypothetical protein [Legionella bononiensis]MBL7563089.1 hypothetical protein [Legionella bononiensis]